MIPACATSPPARYSSSVGLYRNNVARCKVYIARHAAARPQAAAWRRRWLQSVKASASNSGGSESGPSEQSSATPENTGSKRTVSLPLGLPSPGAVFFMAGFLKLLIMCFPFTTISVAMYIHGRADLGYWAVLKMAPLALGLAALAKFVADRKLHERRAFRWALVLGSVLALFLSRLIFFSRGLNPNHPLAPMMRRRQQQHEAMLAYQSEVQRVNQLNRERVLKSPADAEKFLKQRQQWQQQMREAQQQAEREERNAK